MFKKIISLLFSVMIGIALAACGSTDSDETLDSSNNKEEYTKITYAFVSFNTIPSEYADVEEAINKVSRKKIGVEIRLMPLSIADYMQQKNLAVQNGEIDIFHTLGDFAQSVSSEMAYDLTDIIDANAPEAKAVVGKTWLQATSKDGRIYGIPTYKPIALQPMLIYRLDLAEGAGIDMSAVTSLTDLTAVLEKIKETYPEITPFAPVSTGDSGLTRWVSNIDWLGGDFNRPMGVVQNGSGKVESYFMLEEFRTYAAMVRDWYNKGLIMKDAATTTSAAAELMSSGNYFAFSASYSYPLEDTAAQLSASSGHKVGAIALGKPYLDTSSINAVTQMIASTSKNPEAALKFLNLTYSNETVMNTMLYGIEGLDYVKNEDGSVSYPKGQDASTVHYTAQLSCGVLGNFEIQWYLEGAGSPESIIWESEQNKTAPASPYLGFLFDASKVQTQMTAVTNVIRQYLPGLSCGSVDTDSAIEEFEAKLKEAGMDDIMSAKQQQLDDWLAAQPK